MDLVDLAGTARPRNFALNLAYILSNFLFTIRSLSNFIARAIDSIEISKLGFPETKFAQARPAAHSMGR